MGWRESASQACQDDMDALLNAALPFAQQMIAKRGAFFPYGVSLTNAGETKMLAADVGTETPATHDVLETLYDGLRSSAADIRGAAVVTDIRLRDTGEDAIYVEIEHREGVVLGIALPYTKGRSGRGTTYGEMRGIAAERRIWRPPS
jgi:hypothetical protein